MFLGTTDRSNEAYTGTSPGNVFRSKALARFVGASKRDRESLFRVLGTPMKMCPNRNGNKDNAWIEDEIDPHERAHKPEVEMASEEQPEGGNNRKSLALPHVKNAPRI